jgi:hypothetical protein
VRLLARREREKAKGKAGNGFGLTLGMAAQLLPTPNATDSSGPEMGSFLRSIDRLLPTPAAADGQRGPDYAAETREGTGGDSLTTAAAKLMPTPAASDAKGGRSTEGHAPMLAEAAKLLPTPTAGDGKASGSRNLPGSNAHAGVSLTDAVRTGDSTTPRLLPTPQAADGAGGRQEKSAMSSGGKRPSGQKATLPLPTAVSMREELTETPFSGASTSPPSGGGSQCSDEPPLLQLTIGDV